VRLFLLALLLAARGGAQAIEIYSEFHRVDPYGVVVAPDKGRIPPREILSPAALRNGFASFHVTVSVPPKESYLLYVVTNPIDSCRVALYREHFVKTRDGWIPDNLVEVHRLPDYGVMPDPDEQIEGQTTRLYLLDLWIPPGARGGRFRVEVQLKVGDWTVRPMEVRVLSGAFQGAGGSGPGVGVAPVEAPADASAILALLSPSAAGQVATLRDVIRRNALQDATLPVDRDGLMRRIFGTYFAPRIYGSETYLRIRDSLFAQFPE
jgi:hypothetical protein